MKEGVLSEKLFNLKQPQFFSKIKENFKIKGNLKFNIVNNQQFIQKSLNNINQLGQNDNKTPKVLQINQLCNKTSLLQHFKQRSEIPISKYIKPLISKEVFNHVPKLNLMSMKLSQSERKSDLLSTNHKSIYTNTVFMTQKHFKNEIHKRRVSELSIKQQERIKSLSQPKAIRNTHPNPKKHRRLLLSSIKMQFPKQKYKEMCEAFSHSELQTQAMTDRLKDGNEEKVQTVTEQSNQTTRELIRDKKIKNRSRNVALVYVKTTGVANMISKASADLMNYGDNCFKIDDEQFYHRSKEIINNYEYIRQNADVGFDLTEKKKVRYKTFKNNHLKISRAFRTLNQDHAKFIDTLDNYTFRKE